MASHANRRRDTRWPYMALAFLLCAVLWASPAAAQDVLRGFDPGTGYLYLELGTFPQTLEGGLEPILWRILYADSERVYLVSEYVLRNRRIHNDDVAYERSGGDFQSTEMYAYLNGEFLSHFTDGEQALMTAADGGALVTLLSREDLSNKAYGFTDDYARRGYPTPYALQNGLYQYGNGSSPYWTRTQSSSHAYGTVCTKQNGNLGYIRVVVQNEGCRPAICLDAQLLEIRGGSGWFYDPFRVALRGGGEAE